MATTINLSVNAQPAISQLYKVNQVITQVKMNGQSFTLGGKGTNQLSKDLKQTGNTVTTVFGTTKKQLKQVQKEMAGVTAQSKGAIGSIAKFAQGLFSWWTALILAVELAGKTFTYFFNNLTQNVDKLTTRGQTAIKSAQRIEKKQVDEAKTARELIKQLEELNKIQKLNSDQRRLGDSILRKLNKEYKDLGITLDETTGKYGDLYEAQLKNDERQKRSKVASINNQIAGQRDVINAALVKAFGRGIQLDKIVSGKDFFGIAEALGGTLAYQNADLLAKMWNTKDIQKQIAVIEQLVGGLSMSDQVVQNAPAALDAMYVLKDYQDQLRQIKSVSTGITETNKRLADSFKEQRQQIDKTRVAVEKLQQARKEEKRSNVLSNLSAEERIQALKDEVKALEDRNKKLDEAKAGKDKENVQSGLKANFLQTDLQYNQFEQRQLDEQIKAKQQELEKHKQKLAAAQTKYNSSDTYKQLDQREAYIKSQKILQQINEEKGIKQTLSNEIQELGEKLKAKVEQQKKLSIEYNDARKKALGTEQELLSIDQEIEKTLGQIQTRETQIASIEKQLAEDKRKRAEKEQQSIDSITDSYKAQIDAFGKTDLENKIDDALESAKRAKGSDLSPGQVNQITKYVTELDRLTKLEQERKKAKQQSDNIQNVFKGYAQNQSVAYLKLIGKQKEAALLEAKLNAQKAKGAALTEAEYESLKNFVNTQELIEQAISESNNKPQLIATGTITNQLAAKGGFASSVVTDRAQDINAQILKTQNKQYDVQKSIKDAVERYSVIQ